MLPYVFNFSTINSLDCETFHKVRNNVQIVNFDLEQELWMQEGACVFADPDLFFPVGSSMKALKQAAEAKAICNECDVKIDCLELLFVQIKTLESGVELQRTRENQLEESIKKQVLL